MASTNVVDELWIDERCSWLIGNEYDAAWLLGVPVMLVAPFWTNLGSIVGRVRKEDLKRVLTFAEFLREE